MRVDSIWEKEVQGMTRECPGGREFALAMMREYLVIAMTVSYLSSLLEIVSWVYCIELFLGGLMDEGSSRGFDELGAWSHDA